ncbi:ATP-dependent metallopeptidase FtsH/Yme1/Tma family protein [Clostridium sp. YIM B02505]|uniref:ATP-dependent zinc metalloprotease FtsH n=1 Tax=Clostridium yunnanense TaxID=2800325 RepID=A0ABS1ERF3_9CLOT|nr:FtsH/Yme1/Tma family ATP-dependent metallopeptidase [Clostridium yunnanense]MBK1811893.1 ATP-dependent metallopeptidase FtsH/Yme1/Tma family protein [Clostridium yunnanense]
MNKLKNKMIIVPILTAIMSLSALIFYTYYLPTTKVDKNYSEFVKDLDSNVISNVQINDSSKLTVYLKTGESYLVENPNSPSFKESLLTKGVKVKSSSAAPIQKTIPSIILTISVFSIIYISVYRGRTSTSNMTVVDGADVKDSEKKGFSFESMAGNEEAKESVQDIVDFLKNPEKYKKYGARLPKGIILYGEPGTGKTLLAKAVAGEAGVPFYAVSGSDFVQMYVGVGAARIRSLFKKARANGKAVIFIDEIDAIGKRRDGGKTSGGNDERDQTLNALLTEMSGFGEQEGIVIMAATNRLDILDSALLRPGRFDRHVEVILPDVNAREKILNLYFANKPINNIDVRDWANKTTYFSGAKLESLVNEAAILAAKEDSTYITEVHMDKAFSIVIAGHEKNDRSSIRDIDRKITAYHESGHAIVSLIKLPEEKISKVTIIPTTKGAGGYTLTIPEDSAFKTYSYLRKRIMVLLGGRAAEEIIFGSENITTGAYSDISHSTSLAKDMISEYGMGKNLGLLKISSLGDLSSSCGTSVIEECKAMIDELYDETKELLLSNIDKLHSMSQHLLSDETLYTEDLHREMSN